MALTRVRNGIRSTYTPEEEAEKLAEWASEDIKREAEKASRLAQKQKKVELENSIKSKMSAFGLNEEELNVLLNA